MQTINESFKYALALGGGGLSGAYILGVRKALMLLSFPVPKMILASSISAATACLNTLDRLKRAEEIWLKEATVLKMENTSLEALRADFASVIEMIRSGISDSFLSDSPPETHFCLTDAKTGTPHSFRVDLLDSMSQVLAVMSASMALPPLFDSVEWEGNFYVDGDLSWSTGSRYKKIIDKGIDRVIAVECFASEDYNSLLELIGLFNKIKDKSLRTVYKERFRAASDLNKTLKVPILICPSIFLRTGLFRENSPEAIQEAIDLGQKDTLNHPEIIRWVEEINL